MFWKVDPFSHSRNASETSCTHKFMYASEISETTEIILGSMLNAYKSPSMTTLILIFKASKRVYKICFTSPNTWRSAECISNVEFTAISGLYNLRYHLLAKRIFERFSNLTQKIGEHFKSSITSQPGRSCMTGVLNGDVIRYVISDKLDFCDCNWTRT